ncbi:MAG: phosphoribosylformylglycinamidine cyclo-ligase, partial [Candidatus Diapherotrites archaeon]
SSKMKPEIVAEIVSGMAIACKSLNCPLIGGETAEMPGVYLEGEHDIVGFMVGIVEKKNFLDSSKVSEGDVLIALASNGLHTNGFSLARKVLLEEAGFKVTDHIEVLGTTLGDALLSVHKSYSNVVLSLLEKVKVHGVAHITGGGIIENLPRIIPENLDAKYDFDSVKIPSIFRLIQEKGKISDNEMFRTFNMGVGLVLIVSKKDVPKTISFLSSKGESAWVLGEVIKKKN